MLLGSWYTAIVTTTKERTFRNAFVGGAFSFADCLFSFVSGILLNSVGYRGVFITCLAVCVLMALYLGLSVVDE